MKYLWLAGAGMVALLLAFVGLPAMVSFYTDYLWYGSHHATNSFFVQYFSWWKMWTVSMVIFAVWMWHFGLRPLRKLYGAHEPQAYRSQEVKRGMFVGLIFALPGVLIISMLLALWPASQWDTYLLYHNSVLYGMNDPIFGREISYYLFLLPWIQQMSLMAYALCGITLLIQGITFAATSEQYGIENPDKPHVPAMIVQCAVMLAVYGFRTLYVSIPSLAFTGHEAFFGAGYLEASIYGGVYTAVGWFTFVTALFFIVVAMATRKNTEMALWLTGTSLVGWFFVGIIVMQGAVPGIAYLVNVKGRNITVQEPYILNNIAMTREAFGLSKIQNKEFNPTADLGHAREVLERNPLIINNVRLWDWRALQPTLQNMQSLRRYYNFTDVDVDRYVINGQYRQVMISAREIDLNQVPQGDFINKHLQYTHGYGVVVIPVNVVESGKPQFWVKDFPPHSEFPELAITAPQIYFGENTHEWAVVNTSLEEIDYPEGEKNALTRYAGKGGVVLSSFGRKLAYAWKMKSLNLLLTNYITSESKILYDRDVMKIVKKLAPFLTYDKDPYPVIVEGKLYYIIDAMTTSAYFPHSARVGGINYVRNSVKAVVDMYDGTTDFYVFDEKDPLIQAYDKIIPGLFKSKDEMPTGLRAHVRMSEDFFQLVAETYKKYHMSDPHVFYNKEDVWVTGQEVHWVGGKQDVLPYYIVENLSGPTELVLMLPFTPQNKQNMAGWLAGRIEGEEYGTFFSYTFPKQTMVYGTLQVESMINQSPEISEKITLWNQQGSKVAHGNLLVIPVEDVLLFVEPLFIVSETNPMPQLQRVTAMIGEQPIMANTLPDVLTSLFKIPGAIMSPSQSLSRGDAVAGEGGIKKQIKQLIIDIQSIEQQLRELNRLLENQE